MTVTPFNFPFMIPLWSIAFAVITGNAVVLKPSERCPSAPMLLAELFLQAEFPPGVLNVVHGGPQAVDKLLAQPAVQAVSFVGSDIAAERVHEHAVATRKRIQAECGSKNHGVILNDASKEKSLHAIARSAFGAAGQLCMALSVMIFVGSAASWIDDLVAIASSLRVGCGSVSGVDVGPLITPAAKERVEGMIQEAVDEGATLLLDGRYVKVPDYPHGNFVGPTILSNVQPYMQCYQMEILGPVLCCLSVNTLDEAIDIINNNKCKRSNDSVNINGGDH
jgi:malonate-semialdehyde dehydrogenase (acetylating)/methylmalonate-semialdehyde dehydrogenase